MPVEMIRLICPNLKCRSILTAPASARGKAVRCGKCAMKVRVPDGGVLEAKTAAAAQAASGGNESAA